jgi:hypothetical protein
VVAVEDERADGDLDHEVLAALAGLVRSGSGLARVGAVGVAAADREEGVQVRGSDEDDAAAFAAVPAVGAAFRSELLAAEGDDAVAPPAGDDLDLGLVAEHAVKRPRGRRAAGRALRGQASGDARVSARSARCGPCGSTGT